MMRHYLVDTNVVIDMLLYREDAEADPDVDAIITRNVKDFKGALLEVIDSVDFL